MENDKSKKTSWQDKLMEFVNDEFEQEVLEIAIKEQDPEGILLRVEKNIRERLDEDKKTDD